MFYSLDIVILLSKHDLLNLPLYPSITDLELGNIKVLTDMLLEDYSKFPEVCQLGEESARFIRNEMEVT